MKKLLLLFLSLFVFLVPFNFSHASSDSPSDYNVTYTVNQNTNTHVNMSVTLTNQEADSFFASYKLQMGFSDIKNLKASDGSGSITPIVEDSEKGKIIELKFKDKIVGEGKKLTFNLSFDTGEIAQNRGNVWEINIPGVSAKNDFNSFNVDVIYPSNIGKPVYIKPNIPGVLARQAGNKLNFTKSELGTAGISIAFGEHQIYSFDLDYHLRNSNLFPVRTEIAIPPETNYQEITIDSMLPKPNNVRIDSDGNWLAEYSLNPSEVKNIKVNGKAKLFLTPKKEPISESQKKEYLTQKKYWETNDSKIKPLAKDLESPYAIYQFVVKNLTYDFSRVTSSESRLGARDVLDNPKSAVCLEFTDLFIALSRAAGIPTREINGYAYTKTPQERPLSLVKDVLHAWPEYYDDTLETWVMIDPTWGNTTGGIDYFFTLDLDHFTFIRKGESSSYPVPPGGYKLSSNDSQKDVNVELDSKFEKIQDFNVKPSFPNPAFSAVPLEGSVKIVNTGNSLIENKTMDISTDFLLPQKQTIQINQIPPFGYHDSKISYEKTAFLTNKSDIITIRLDETINFANVRITPFYFSKKIIVGGIIFAISILILSLIIYKSRRIFVSRSKEQGNIRRES